MEKMSREEKKNYLLSEIYKRMEENGGIIKTSEILAIGVDYRRILSWVEEGTLQRVKSGYYSANYEDKSEEAIVAGLFPDAVLCMDSALYYYHYLKERPYSWHLAVDKNTSKSRFKLDYPVIKPYYTEEEVLQMGVSTIMVGSHKMKIYKKERLICDCLKFEEKLEREVLKQAMSAFIKDEEKDVSELMEYARERKVVQKVQNMIGVWL